MAKYNLDIIIPSGTKEYSKLWAREFRKKYPEIANKWQNKYRKETPLKYLFNLAKRRAKRKGIEFDITVEDLGKLPNICPLLLISIDAFSINQDNHPSIDRIDNSKGYIKGNVIIVSYRANRLKNDSNENELLLLATNLLNLKGDK